MSDNLSAPGVGMPEPERYRQGSVRYKGHTMYRVILLAVALALPAGAANADIPLDQNLSMATWLKKDKRQNRYRRTAPRPQPTASTSATTATTAPTIKKSKEKWVGGPRPNITGAAPATVRFQSGYGQGTIVIDTSRRRLFYVLSSSTAYSYPIAVGRAGFQWTGNKRITNVRNWPDWRPPAEMRRRQPNLPKIMTGGIYNPLGAKALYLGSSLYRIHGTANAQSIGTASSSGCFRMHNKHVVHLAQRAGVGTRVVVLRRLPGNIARSITGNSSG